MTKSIVNSGENIHDSDFLKAEHDLQIILPQSFKDFWTKNNGGDPKNKLFEVDGQIWVLNHIFNLSEVIQSWEYTKSTPPIADSHIFCIGETLGSSVIGMGYGQNNNGHIFLVDFEYQENIKVSNNIQDFVDSLREG